MPGNSSRQTPSTEVPMHKQARNRPYCIYEALTDIAGGWSMRCLIGAQLLERREFAPAPGEDSEMVLA